MEDRRFVAFVDLLGFKRLVLSRSLETTVQIFSRVFYSLGASTARHIVRSNLDPDSINERLDPFPDGKDLPEVIAWFEKETGFSVQIMSDSVILYSEALAPGNPPFLHRLTELILICRTLMLTLFKETLPARGAAAFGEFYVDRASGIYIGKALAEAYTLAETQEWIGFSISDSLAESIKTLVESSSPERWAEHVMNHNRSDLLRPQWDVLLYDVPMKKGEQRRWVVNWVSAWNAGGPVRDDFFDDILTDEPQIDQKYQNTLKFMKQFGSEIAPT